MVERDELRSRRVCSSRICRRSNHCQNVVENSHGDGSSDWGSCSCSCPWNLKSLTESRSARRVNSDRSIKACTLISVLGLINLVIIKYSVEWWSTLHQPSSISLTRETTVHFSMLIPLGLMLLALIMYVAVIFLMKYRIETIRIKRKGIRKL